MTKKKKPFSDSKSGKDREREKRIARGLLDPAYLSSATVQTLHLNNEHLNFSDLSEEMQAQVKKVNEGNLSRAEALLICQAHSLNSISTEMMRKSLENMGQNFHVAEKLMRLGLKAQSQSRATIQTLADLKNPKPYIQNNRAQYQQVNNNSSPSRAREKENFTNELLEDRTDEQQWMDCGAQKDAGGEDQELEAVEIEHRPEDKDR
jgi:hypothetical protein